MVGWARGWGGNVFKTKALMGGRRVGWGGARGWGWGGNAFRTKAFSNFQHCNNVEAIHKQGIIF